MGELIEFGDTRKIFTNPEKESTRIISLDASVVSFWHSFQSKDYPINKRFMKVMKRINGLKASISQMLALVHQQLYKAGKHC
jgi:hypothetical protein